MTIETKFSLGDRLRYYTKDNARQIDFTVDEIHVHLTNNGQSEFYRGKGAIHPVHSERLQKLI